MKFGMTETDMRSNVRLMLKSSAVPFFVTLALYTLISLFAPEKELCTSLISALGEEFKLGWYCLIPAALASAAHSLTCIWISRDSAKIVLYTLRTPSPLPLSFTSAVTFFRISCSRSG